MTPGKFIISARPITRRRRRRPWRSPAVSGRRGDSKADAGTQDDAVKYTSSGRPEQTSSSQWMPSRAEDVRDLVRVGDDGRRAHRQHEPRELVDEELRRLEVHVRVDEAGDDVRAADVERLRPFVVAQAGDVAVTDSDVHLEPLAREDREHAAALDDEVGRLVPACDCYAAGEVGHRAMSSGRTGTRASSRPVASRNAERTAAVDTTVGGSPTPLSP